MTKRGILIMAYGGPNKMEDIKPFYTDIRRGKEPPVQLLRELIDRYRMIGGKSPLLDITKAQAHALGSALNDKYPVYTGMRHREPWIEDAIREMKEDGIEEAVSLVMAPHYSKMSIGKYMDAVHEALEKHEYPLELHAIKSWHDHPGYIEAVTQKIFRALNNFPENVRGEVMLLFTAHSLPQRILEWNDPYPKQLHETSELIISRLGHRKWDFAYQSAGRTSEPWLGPDIVEAIHDLSSSGEKNLLVCPIGFIADHLEVIYDIDIEAKPEAEKAGVHLERTESLNDDPLLIRAFADMVNNSWNG